MEPLSLSASSAPVAQGDRKNNSNLLNDTSVHVGSAEGLACHEIRDDGIHDEKASQHTPQTTQLDHDSDPEHTDVEMTLVEAEPAHTHTRCEHAIDDELTMADDVQDIGTLEIVHVSQTESGQSSVEQLALLTEQHDLIDAGTNADSEDEDSEEV